jgi:hypothetical protein
MSLSGEPAVSVIDHHGELRRRTLSADQHAALWAKTLHRGAQGIVEVVAGRRAPDGTLTMRSRCDPARFPPAGDITALVALVGLRHPAGAPRGALVQGRRRAGGALRLGGHRRARRPRAPAGLRAAPPPGGLLGLGRRARLLAPVPAAGRRGPGGHQPHAGGPPGRRPVVHRPGADHARGGQPQPQGRPALSPGLRRPGIAAHRTRAPGGRPGRPPPAATAAQRGPTAPGRRLPGGRRRRPGGPPGLLRRPGRARGARRRRARALPAARPPRADGQLHGLPHRQQGLAMLRLRARGHDLRPGLAAGRRPMGPRPARRAVQGRQARRPTAPGPRAPAPAAATRRDRATDAARAATGGRP